MIRSILIVQFLALGSLVAAAGCGGGSGGGGTDDGGDDGGGDDRIVAAAARTGDFGFRVTAVPAAPKPGGGSTAFDVDPGTQALRLNIDDAREKRWQACFSMNMDNFVLGDGDRIEVLNGYSDNGDLQFTTFVQGQAGQNILLVGARMDNGTLLGQSIGEGTPLPNGYNSITIRWDALSQEMGGLINDAELNDLVSLENGNQQLDFIRFGAVDGDGTSAGGTIDFDDFCENFTAQFDPLVADSGLPPGTTLVFEHLDDFLTSTCPGCGVPGGTLGGAVITTKGFAMLQVTGTGGLSSYSRTLLLPFTLVVDAGPVIIASFGGFTIQTELIEMSLDLFGDPDFSALSIRAGTDAGLPTPSTGTTTLTENGNRFLVDSFFDIEYTIEFDGAPGGQLDGISTGTPTPRMESDWDLVLDIDTFGSIFTDGFESGDTAAWD